MTKVICPQCGTVSEVVTQVGDDEEEWLGCITPDGFEYKLPAGRITPVVGEPIYISAVGEHMSRDAFIEKYGIDPEVAYQKMRFAMVQKKPVLRLGSLAKY